MNWSSLFFKEIWKNGTNDLDVCLRLPKESNKSRFDSYNVRNSVACTFFPTTFLKKAVCILKTYFVILSVCESSVYIIISAKAIYELKYHTPGGTQGKFISWEVPLTKRLTLPKRVFGAFIQRFGRNRNWNFCAVAVYIVLLGQMLHWFELPRMSNVNGDGRNRSDEEKSKAWNLSYHHIVRYPLMTRRRYWLLLLELTRGRYAHDTSNITRKEPVYWVMPDLVTALTGHCFESNSCLRANSTLHLKETFDWRTRTFAYSQKINRRSGKFHCTFFHQKS